MKNDRKSRGFIQWSKENYAVYIAGFIACGVIYFVTTYEVGPGKVQASRMVKGVVSDIAIQDGGKAHGPTQFIYVNTAKDKNPLLIKLPDGQTAIKNKPVILNCKTYQSGKELCDFDRYTD